VRPQLDARKAKDEQHIATASESGPMIESLRITVERLSTEVDAAKAREQDALRKTELSAIELKSMRNQVKSMQDQLQRQATEVRSSYSMFGFWLTSDATIYRRHL
jgi:hypothetical protein